MIGASCCLFDWLGLSRLAGLRSAQAGQFTPRAQTQKKRRLGCRWAHWHFACWYVPSNLHVKGHQGALSAGRASFRDCSLRGRPQWPGIQPQVPNGGPRLAATPRAPARPFRSPATRDLEAKSQAPCARSAAHWRWRSPFGHGRHRIFRAQYSCMRTHSPTI
jgi:hypothetical protein